MKRSLRAGAPWIGALLLAAAPAAGREDVPRPEPGVEAPASDTVPAVEPSDEGAGDDLEAYWSQRLSRARQRIELARERLAAAEAEYARARRDDYPRGDAFEAIEQRKAAAEREQRAAEDALPRLVEQARRAGVAPGVLRDYWDPEGEAGSD